MYRLFILTLIFPTVLWAQYVPNQEYENCSAAGLSSNSFNDDLMALETFVRQSCEGAQALNKANSEGGRRFCKLNQLVSRFQSLRNHISEAINNEQLRMNPSWGLADITGGLFTLEFRISDRDIGQDLLEYAILRPTLFQNLDLIKPIFEKNQAVQYRKGATCVMPRLKAFLAGETKAYQTWAYHSTVECRSTPEAKKLYAGLGSCEQVRATWLKMVENAMASNSVASAIEISRTTDALGQMNELAQIEAYTMAHTLSQAYVKVANSKLEPDKVLNWLNSKEKCGTNKSSDSLTNALNGLCLKLKESDESPTDPSDETKVKIALFAVMASELRDLNQKIEKKPVVTKTNSFDETQLAIGENMKGQVEGLLEFFLSIHQQLFNPTFGD